MEEFLERISSFTFKHSRIVRWWFNRNISLKLILAFTINALATLSAGLVTYYLVQTGTIEQDIRILLVLIAIVSLFIVLYGFYIAFLTATPIRHSVEFAKTVAEGDLTPNLTCMTQKDEVGLLCKSLNTMVESFRSLVGNITYGADIFAESSGTLSEQAETTMHAAQEVADAINQVSQGSQSQAISVQAILEAVQEMSRGIQNIESSVRLAREASGQALQVAVEGDRSVAHTNSQMQQIHATVAKTGEIVSELGEKSASIGSIVETIKAISDQTNLLALNAAIEAARAGEHGRGFSVVAEEVRKLAEQSTLSSAQIEQIIHDIKLNVDRAITSMESEKEVVLSGSQVIEEAQQSFNRIVESTQIVNQHIEAVSQFTQNIALSSQHISDEITRVATISEETTAQSEEVAANSTEQMNAMKEINASTTELSSAAQELQSASRKFRLA